MSAEIKDNKGEVFRHEGVLGDVQVSLTWTRLPQEHEQTLALAIEAAIAAMLAAMAKESNNEP